jgi:hypothetical protein
MTPLSCPGRDALPLPIVRFETPMRSAIAATAPRAFALYVLAAAAQAQSPLQFTLDQSASNWTWSATTSLGNVVGVPDNNFQVNGSQAALLSRGAWPIATGEWLGGVANVVPDIHAEIPNPIALLPPLATLDIENLSLSFSSTTFAVAADGSFATDIATLVLSGTVTLDPLVGSTTVSDLTGAGGDPQPVTGTITQLGTNISFSIPLSADFDFTDPSSGTTASMTLSGVLVGNYDCAPATDYCASNANSTGQVASFSASGSTRIQDNAMLFDVVNLPTNKFGYFLMSNTQASVPNFGGSQGVLCLGSPLVRFAGNVLNSGAGGVMSFSPDMTSLPGSVEFDIGASWNFQLWYRDNNPGSTSNTSNGLQVVFCP